ncbi:hypothetical protein [Cellvibrio sp. OA-2007]|uniref:hypothetical protein n=1 Tax=Cellvibrio sp. OA-2007 TaxID=529823 RepID=UPI0007824F52|nr:hypothetical protein [Cellvibrio sp. OA-2007]
MKYHGALLLSGNKMLSFSNESEEYAIKNFLIPFINGQVIETSTNGSETHQSLINMKSAVAMSIYRTETDIDHSKFSFSFAHGNIEREYGEFDCTSEFVEKVKELQTNPSTRSLLELAFRKPENQIFVIMKFGDPLLDSAYEGVIKPLGKEFDICVVRVDEIQDSGKINDQILENIAKSRLVISDLSGERPNCYYETGFSHALGKDIILTIHKDSDVHFDLTNYRFIKWGTEKELRDRLRERMSSMLRDRS